MDFKEWPDILPILQSAINNAPSPQRGNFAPITAFHVIQLTPPISTFYRSETAKSITVDQLIREHAMNVNELVKLVAELHPRIYHTLQEQRQRGRDAASHGRLPNFDIGDYVLVARLDFHNGEKLALRWRGPCRIIKAVKDFVYFVQDLGNDIEGEIHGSRLKLYCDSELYTETIMSHVLTSETFMKVSR